MFQRLLVWAVRSYVRGPGRSWIYTSLALWLVRLVRRVTGRRPVVERLSVSPGQNLTIDHLQVTHRAQIKDEKRARKRSRPWRRAAAS
jgi:1-acyl-sn-glycerol-3-phosphate acyltransferase